MSGARAERGGNPLIEASRGGNVGPAAPRCLGCGYLLVHLPQPRCPECGRPFDLSNPATFHVPNPRAQRAYDWQITLLGGVAGLLAVFVPWMLAQRLRLFDKTGMTVWAGVACLLFGLGWSMFLRGSAWLIGIGMLPAVALIGVAAYNDWFGWPAVAAAAGAGGAVLIRRVFLSMRENTEA